MSNRFSDASNVTELVYQLVGASSMCWENVRGAGVFDDGKANDFAEDALARLSELQVIP